MRKLAVVLVLFLVGVGTAQAGPAGRGGTIPPSAPVGFAVTVAGAAPAPTSLDFSDDGDTLYVSSVGGVVTAHPVLGGVVTGRPTVFLDGLVQPLGVLAVDLNSDGVDEVFISDKQFNVATNRDEGLVLLARDTDADGEADSVTTVVSGLPNGRHNTNGMAIGPDDGLLYIANGNSNDSGFNNEGGDPEIQPYSGSLLRISPTVSNKAPSDTTVVGTGWRNIYDVAFAPEGHPLNPSGSVQIAAVPMNGPDGQTFGAITRPAGEDTLSILDVDTTAVEHFGFPWCLYENDGAGGIDEFAQDTSEGSCDPLTSDAGTGISGGVTKALPDALFGLHVSANGLAFNPGTDFPASYDDDLFVAEWGNLFGEETTGHKVVRVSFDSTGAVTDVRDFMTGIVPLDLTFAPDGALWVADTAGTIYRVSSPL